MAGSGKLQPASGNTRPDPIRTRRRRGSVTPEDMIDGAFALAEQIGLTKLSMPQLARHLEVPVTTIYWHFRQKEQLLDAMMDRAADQYHFATPFTGEESWDEALRNHFRKMRKVFAENPLVCELVLMRANQYSPESSIAAVEKLEAVIATLGEAGFSPENALEVYLALSIHSRGSAMIDHLHSQPADEAKSRGKQTPLLRQLAATSALSEQTPLLLELAGRGHTVTDVNFEFTLEAIIDRARMLLAEDKKAKRRRRQANPT